MQNNSSNNLKKYISLILFTIQATCFVLVSRYSRLSSNSKKNQNSSLYLISTAVVCVEILKLIICLIIIHIQAGFSIKGTLNQLNNDIIKKPNDAFKLLIPALLYTLQNNLYFVALSHLDAVTFQVTYQLKIFATAFFSYIILRKRLDFMKCLSLVVLVIGVLLVKFSSNSVGLKVNIEKSTNDNLIGFTSILICCLCSGIASVYLEKIFKESKTSLWIRNVPLGIFCTIIALVNVYTYDYYRVKEDGFFQGYNPLVCTVIALQAIGGLIVATVITYADNILKEFANSASMIITSFVSYFILKDFIPNELFVSGACLVIFSTFLFNHEKSTVAKG